MLILERSDGFLLNTCSFREGDARMVLDSQSLAKHDFGAMVSPKCSQERSLRSCLSFKDWQTKESEFEFAKSVTRSSDVDHPDSVLRSCSVVDCMPNIASFQPELLSPKPDMEPDEAAVKLQKVYKSYRTRRNLADCAVVVEELWWKAFDYASLNMSSVSFYGVGKSETTVSRWARAKRRAAKVGKGLSKDGKAQKLALRHWLEAIDPRHRYGHNLSKYYDIWFKSESTQPFFYWLDIGEGKELDLASCPREVLQKECIQYLGPKEREAHEVIVRSGKLVYRTSEELLTTAEGSKWIFVLSPCRNLYVGKKIKGKFQHSSFLSGAAATAAGRLVAKDGILEAIWPYSGHYLPTEENFKQLIHFLRENNVDLTNVKRGVVDDDDYSSTTFGDHSFIGLEEDATAKNGSSNTSSNSDDSNEDVEEIVGTPKYEFSDFMPTKWATGAGARIGCVRDYPSDLQVKALEQVSLSPLHPNTPSSNKVSIPSPRPSPKLRLSPRVARMGISSPLQSPRLGNFVIPTPTISLTLPSLKRR